MKSKSSKKQKSNKNQRKKISKEIMNYRRRKWKNLNY